MNKVDEVLNKTKRKSETKKWKMYVFAVLGVLIVVSGFFGGMALLNPIVDEYLHNKKDIVAVYDFLDLKVGLNETAVYFMGSSIVGNGIDAEEINKILNERGYNIKVYNIAINAATPSQRTVLTQNIIESHPALVVFGESYYMLKNHTLNDERIFVVKDRLKLREDSFHLYSTEDYNVLTKTYTLLDNKRLLRNAILYSLTDRTKINVSDTVDLYTVAFGKNWRSNEETNPNYSRQGIINDANSGGWSPEITTQTTSGKEAIAYNAKALRDAGIKTVIVNMPLHPLISEHVTAESRQNTFDFLNSTGSKWYDYEFACPDEDCWYKDGHHLAPVTGAKAFAPLMADLIIQELS